MQHWGAPSFDCALGEAEDNASLDEDGDRRYRISNCFETPMQFPFDTRQLFDYEGGAGTPGAVRQDQSSVADRAPQAAPKSGSSVGKHCLRQFVHSQTNAIRSKW